MILIEDVQVVQKDFTIEIMTELPATFITEKVFAGPLLLIITAAWFILIFGLLRIGILQLFKYIFVDYHDFVEPSPHIFKYIQNFHKHRICHTLSFQVIDVDTNSDEGENCQNENVRLSNFIMKLMIHVDIRKILHFVGCDVIQQNATTQIHQCREREMKSHRVLEKFHGLLRQFFVEYLGLLIKSHKADFVKPISNQEIQGADGIHYWQPGRISQTHKKDRESLGEIVPDSDLGTSVDLIQVILAVLSCSGAIQFVGGPRELEGPIVKSFEIVQKYSEKVATFCGKCLNDHGQAKLGSECDIPLGVKLTFNTKFLISNNQNDPDIDELLHEYQSENGLVFDCRTILVLKFGCNNEQLLRDNIDGYDDQRLRVNHHLILIVGLEPSKTAVPIIALQYLVKICEAVAMEDFAF